MTGRFAVGVLFLTLSGLAGPVLARAAARVQWLEWLGDRGFWRGREGELLERLPDGASPAEIEELLRAYARYRGFDDPKDLRHLARDRDGDGLVDFYDPKPGALSADRDGDGLADGIDLAPDGPGSAFPWIPKRVIAAQEGLLRQGLLYVPSLLGVAPLRIENLARDLGVHPRWMEGYRRARGTGQLYVLRESSLYFEGLPPSGDRDYDGLPDRWDAEPLGAGSRRGDADGDGLVDAVDLAPRGTDMRSGFSQEDRRWQERFWIEHGIVVDHARHPIPARVLARLDQDLSWLGTRRKDYLRSSALRVLLASESRGMNRVRAWYDPARALITVRRPGTMTRRIWLHEWGHVSEELFKGLAVEHFLALRRQRPSTSRREGEEDFAWTFADWVMAGDGRRRSRAALRRVDDCMGQPAR